MPLPSPKPNEKKPGRAEEAAAPNPGLFYRSVTITSEMVTDDHRLRDVPFSSEARVKRWFGIEILRHSPKAANFKRLNDVGAALFNHNPNFIAGPIERAALGNDRRGHADIRFDQDDQGKFVEGKVKSGSLRGLSMGYLIHRAQRVEDGAIFEDPELGRIVGPALIGEDWEPAEITFTPLPADADVGIGRDATRSLDGIEIEAPQSTETEKDPMDTKLKAYLVGRGLKAEATDEETQNFLAALPAQDAELAARAVKPADKKPEPKPADNLPVAPDYRGLCNRARALGLSDLAVRMIGEGKPEAEIQAALLDELGKSRGKPLGPDAKKDEEPALKRVSDDDLLGAIKEPQLSLR